MKQDIIYALDFDGVICDSAVETAITGWKAGSTLWGDMETPLPPQTLIEQFRLVRPLLETGYESILIMRLLHNGETVEALLSDYAEKIQQTLSHLNKDVAFLKKLFGETRDNWINQDLTEWVTMNPLFPHVAEKLQKLNQNALWYIITTKLERFVSQILNACKIELAREKIFGLDRNMSKETVLTELLAKHPQQEFYFVEDRLPTLFNVLSNDRLDSIKLFFAGWGYNTEHDKLRASKQPRIELIDIDDFLK